MRVVALFRPAFMRSHLVADVILAGGLLVQSAKELAGELLQLSAQKASCSLPAEHAAYNDGRHAASVWARSCIVGRYSLSTQTGKSLKSMSTNNKFNSASLIGRVCQQGMMAWEPRPVSFRRIRMLLRGTDSASSSCCS